MLYSDYEKILLKNKKVEWYDTMVPEKLLTKQVLEISEQIIEQINKYESTDFKKDYIIKLWDNIRSLPYRMNGDFYLTKKKEIEEKTGKKIKIKQEKSNNISTLEEKKTTKNSNLIFGNKK